MKFGVPWSVKGIRPEARETAREAARRSGMPLGEWLNTVILQQAEDDGVSRSRYRDDDDDETTSVHERLDEIASRIDKMSRTGPSAYAPKHVRQEQGRPQTDQQIAQLIDRLDRRLEQFINAPHVMSPRMMAPPLAPAQMPMHPMHQQVYPAMMAPQPMPPRMQPTAPRMPPAVPPRPMMPPGLDRAITEIAARQRALNGQPAQAQQPQAPAEQAPMLVPVPSQDLSGLEDHLRQITDQIETLRHPGVEDAINALRNELGEIGQALNEAMPRQAIETIEKQIQGLTQRIAEERQANRGAGVDAGALSGVEHGLAEVRDALRGLTPAENLVGFNDAVQSLAHKIDLIVAQKDPQTISQLEHAINTLREMAAHVASGEAVGHLAAQVQELAAKVDYFGRTAGGSEALNNLEHRISALADALAERTQSGGSVPPRLEALVESLSDKIEQIQHIQQTPGDSVAAGHLEDQIVALVQRLDASDSRLGHLEAIERGLADLLVHVEEIRAGKVSGGDEVPPAVIALKQDIARTQDALDAVHGTLGLVVDRLATIERNVRGERRTVAADPDTLELAHPVGRVAARAIVDEPSPPAGPPKFEPPAPPPQTPPQIFAHIPQPAPQLEVQRPPQASAPQPTPQPNPRPMPPQPAPQAAAPKRMPPAARPPIDPNLPPDQPLEPGSGPPSMRASARIAASEAALGGARPAPGAGPAGKSGFIAAARRAAQAAVESAKPRAPQPQPAEVHAGYDENSDARPSLRASMMKKVKSLFIAASLVAIVIGSIQIGANFLDFGGAGKRHADLAQAPEQDVTGELDTTEAVSKPAVKSAAIPLNPPMLPGYMRPSQSQGAGALASKLPSVLYPAGQPEPSLLNPPALNPPPVATGDDVTGSIPHPAAKSRPAPRQAIPEDDALPTGIGGAKLRSAAVAGDATAAYEVAVRFSEGRGVPADLQEAARWYERAAMKGLVPAQFRYASLLEKGIGVKKNLGQARRFYLAAANKGHAKAMHNLAVLYAEGIEGKPDYATAVYWFRKAAEHGIADSQYNLGILYARGLGTEKNVTESYKWFSLAAKQGDPEAVKKRAEVVGLLDATTLAAAENAVRAFVPESQPHNATVVPAPRGGWDESSGASSHQPRTPRDISAAAPATSYATARR
jgi:localization factor PodJL